MKITFAPVQENSFSVDIEKNFYPCFSVINPYRSGDWIERFSFTKNGFIEAQKYCVENNLHFVRYSKSPEHVKVLWENKNIKENNKPIKI
jgi:hypothetical protein